MSFFNTQATGKRERQNVLFRFWFTRKEKEKSFKKSLTRLKRFLPLQSQQTGSHLTDVKGHNKQD
jgi:hypothetical protein